MTSGNRSLCLVVTLLWSYSLMGTYQLQSSQIQVLLQLRKQLEYPSQLEVWNNDKEKICNLSPSTKVNVTCKGDVITELRIMGDKPSKLRNFDGYSIPNQTLSTAFSMDSFVATLARLNNLRVLSLVALGIWGSVPTKIDRLSSLEFLDLSSNFLYGSIPPRIATMVKLQTLRIDSNFFNASMPNWLDSLSNLTVLSLTNNQLTGPFPASIRKISTLNTLALSNNKIYGVLPNLSSLNHLKVLNLSGNRFESELPNLPSSLLMALLNNNSFTGEIPQGFQHLYRLQYLDLSLNHLRGRLSAALFSLTNIDYLNLASNELTGSLPFNLACGQRLDNVDISNNKLTGELPKCLTKIATHCYGNCLTVNTHHQHPQSHCAGSHLKKNSMAKVVVLLVALIIGVVVGLLAFGFLCMWRRYCSGDCQEQNHLQEEVQESGATGLTSNIIADATAMSGTQGLPGCRIISSEELKEATRNFDRSTLMSEGYKGKLYRGRLQDGTVVAIRSLSLSSKYTTRNFKLRMNLMAKLRHPHLVCLLGHCIDNSEKADPGESMVYLVYEYVPNGNLLCHLIGNGQVRALNWPERLTILIDIAKAVHFLHTGVIPGVFNNQLKSNNILLDELRRAKLSDYGLSIIYDDNEVGVKDGDSERKSWGMKIVEDDIYNFGFIMFDSIIGPSVSAKKNDFLLHEMISLGSEEGQRKIVNPIVLSTSRTESLLTVISLANKCVSFESSTRPSFEDVLWNLENAARLQTTDGNSPACS